MQRYCKRLLLGASPMALMAGLAAADGGDAAGVTASRPSLTPSTQAASHPAAPEALQRGGPGAPPLGMAQGRGGFGGRG